LIDSTSQLGFHQVEQITDLLHESQFLRREPDVKLALDSHHQPNQVDRIEPQRLAKILVVLRKLERLAHLFFEQA
jgi:hypothetical protein